MTNVYFLKSLKIENWYYVGICHNLKKRLQQHKTGNVKSTKSKRPLKFVYVELYQTILEARKREIFLKSPKGYLEKKKIIKNLNNKPG